MLPLSLTATRQRSAEEKHFRMQSTGPNSHADGAARTHARQEITYLMCCFLSLCLCNVMRWQQLRTLLPQSNAGEDKLMKPETAAHPLTSRLVALRLSTRIRLTLPTAHVCLKRGQRGECEPTETRRRQSSCCGPTIHQPLSRGASIR